MMNGTMDEGAVEGVVTRCGGRHELAAKALVFELAHGRSLPEALAMVMEDFGEACEGCPQRASAA